MRIRIKYAPPADEALLDEIRAGFISIYGRSVVFEAEEDDTLLGGFVAYVDGKIYDMSLRNRLDELRARLTSPTGV